MQGTGDYGHYDPNDQATIATSASRDIRAAERNHTHLWVATVAYRVTDPTLPTHTLDHRTLFIPPLVGCVVCETEYAPGMERTACTGDPS